MKVIITIPENASEALVEHIKFHGIYEENSNRVELPCLTLRYLHEILSDCENIENKYIDFSITPLHTTNEKGIPEDIFLIIPNILEKELITKEGKTL